MLVHMKHGLIFKIWQPVMLAHFTHSHCPESLTYFGIAVLASSFLGIFSWVGCVSVSVCFCVCVCFPVRVSIFLELCERVCVQEYQAEVKHTVILPRCRSVQCLKHNILHSVN